MKAARRTLSLLLSCTLLAPAVQAAQRLDVQGLLAMHQRGEPQTKLLEALRTQPLDFGNWDVSFGGLHTGEATVGLSGSQLARLHEEGLSDEVLDLLQARFVAQVRQDAWRRYRLLGKGPNH